MLENSSQKIFVLIVAALVSGVAGFGLIRLMRTVSQIEGGLPEENQLEESEESAGGENQEQGGRLENGWSSYSGIIQIAREVHGKATHILVDENGDLIIYLMADDQKLVISEAMEVEVQGTLESLKDVTEPLMRVERVVFK